MASVAGDKAKNNTELVNVTFIQQTMKTLSAYNEQLQTGLDIDLNRKRYVNQDQET